MLRLGRDFLLWRRHVFVVVIVIVASSPAKISWAFVFVRLSILQVTCERSV